MASPIIFGTTLTADCQPLADVAALLAKRKNVPLRLVHVSEDRRAPIVLGTDEEHILGPVRSTLAAEAERVSAAAGIDVQVHLAGGNVVEALLGVARFEMATMLVIGGTSGGTPLLGSTAERVSQQDSVPTLVLRWPERLLAWLRGERPLRILVGADLGRASQAARVFAGGLSAAGDVEIETVVVVSPAEAHRELGLPPAEGGHGLSEEAEAVLLRELERSTPADAKETKLSVLAGRGSADAHLVSLADRGNFDLVVVGQRRRSPIEALWYGSVARGVLRASPVSVACVPITNAVPPASVRKPLAVLVATDFTEISERVVAHGLGVVSAEGTVHLAHVVTSPAANEVDARRDREQAWYTLSRLAAAEKAEYTGRVERHVLEGAPAEQLLALAKRIGADLIVLGSRARSMASRTLFGSIAQAVSERSKVPVLLVPEEEE